MSWEEIAKLNVEAASMLVEAGNIEVKVGEKTGLDMLAKLTKIDKDVADKLLGAAQLESKAISITTQYGHTPDSDRLFLEAARQRKRACQEKWEAAQELNDFANQWLGRHKRRSKRSKSKKHRRSHRSRRI